MKNSKDVEFHSFLTQGNLLFEKERRTEAIAEYRKAIALKPDVPDIWCNLAASLHLEGEFAEAEESYLRALSLNKDLVKVHTNLGALYQELGKYQKAAESCLKAISLNPDAADAHMNLAMILLLAGNYESGWREYEWRLALGGNKALGIQKKVWDGSALGGKRIYVYAEQGFGDTLQFIRFLPEIQKSGGYVIFECQKELYSLLKNIDGADEVVEANPENPKTLRYEEHVPLLSLPRIFSTTPQNIPQQSVLVKGSPEQVEKWKRKLSSDTGVKVGIAWAGAPGYIFDRHRSCSLGDFSPLSRVKGVTFYNLQYGAGRNGTLQGNGLDLINFEEKIEGFHDRAALIENLDLVISVDTSIGHLAGAMGKNTWLLLSAAPDWRWLLEHPDSTPWYPSTTLFRQSNLDDWFGVFTRVRIALTKLVQNR